MNINILNSDSTGHAFGPETEEMKKKLLELDSNLGYMIRKLKENELFNELNIIITSDHGMQSLTKNIDKNVYLEKYVDLNLFNSYGGSVVKSLFVKNSNTLLINLLNV